MARATLEIVASAVDRASPVLNRIGETGRVAAQRVATAWNTVTAPFTAVTRRIKLVETALFAFLGSQAIRGLDRFFDKFGGAQYDAGRAKFVSSMQKLGDALGKTIGPKFGDALDKLSAWVDRNADSIVKMFSGITDAILGTVSALASLGGWLAAWQGAIFPTRSQRVEDARWSGQVQRPGDVARSLHLEATRMLGERYHPLTRGAPSGDTPFEGGGGLMFPPWLQQQLDTDILRRLTARGPRGGGPSYLRDSGFGRVQPWEAEPPRETFMGRLRNEWTVTTAEIEERGLHLARTFEYSLGSAITNTILGVEKASEAFKMFAKSVVATVVQMFVETGIRQLLGSIVGGISGGGGGGDGRLTLPGGQGPLNLGGGGGGGGPGTVVINAVDSQSFAQAMRRAEMERGATSRVVQNATQYNPTFRQVLQLR